MHQDIISILLWLRSSSQVTFARRNLVNCDTFGEELRHLLLLDTGHHHAGAPLPPVYGCGHLLAGGQLETVHHSEDLVKVASSCCRVEERQLESLVWTNDEDCSAGERNTSSILLIRVHHTIHLSNISARVSDDGVGELSQVVVRLDVIDPAMVRLHAITRQSDQLDSSLGELLAESLDSAQLSGADRSEVSGVGEEDGPALSYPGVEINLSLGGLSREVRHLVSKLWHLE